MPLRAIAMPALFVSAVTGVLVLFTGLEVYSAQMDEVRRQAVDHVRTDAVLVEPSGSAPASGRAGAGAASPQGHVRWTGPDGVTRTASVTVPSNRPAGTHVMVWTDASGAPTSRPASHGGAVGTAIAAGVVAGLALLVGLCAGRAACRFCTARWAASQIDDEWRLIASEWTGRRST